jgi:hypothetical protein
MKRLALASMLLVASLAACGSIPPRPSAAPWLGAPSPAAPGSTGLPTTAPPASPTAGLTVEEQHLLDGVRRGAIDCRPLREGLPDRATAAIECAADDAAVATVAVASFADEADMLAAYYARMDAAGVRRNSVACIDGAGESPYTPGPDDVPSRHGCYLNEAGSASYWATLPGQHVLLGVVGRTTDMHVLQDFAWLGNQDAPGAPTLWGDPAAG